MWQLISSIDYLSLAVAIAACALVYLAFAQYAYADPLPRYWLYVAAWVAFMAPALYATGVYTVLPAPPPYVKWLGQVNLWYVIIASGGGVAGGLSSALMQRS